jgi:transcriptional regulator with XRE-family HTH domain
LRIDPYLLPAENLWPRPAGAAVAIHGSKREKRGNNVPQFWEWRIALNWIVVYATSVKTARVSSSKFAARSCGLRSLLRERLSSAKTRNPRFWLRSFAKQLGVDHSTLSQILRSKRRLSPRYLETAGGRLALSTRGSSAVRSEWQKKIRFGQDSRECPYLPL